MNCILGGRGIMQLPEGSNPWDLFSGAIPGDGSTSTTQVPPPPFPPRGAAVMSFHMI